MRSPCDPPKFDEQDWSEFDFSRWHVAGLPADAAAKALADLAERFFSAPEWREHFQASVPDVERAARAFYRKQAADLRKEGTAAEREFDQRTAAAEQRLEEYRRTIAAAAEPPTVDSSPETYRLAVKVTGKSKQLGLGGLAVRIRDPKNKKVPLVETVTDPDGNATLSVPPEKAQEFANVHADLDVRTLEGKSLQELKGAICIRLNQTETKVIRLADLAEIEPHTAAALETRAARDRTAESLAGRIDRLKHEKEERVRDVECRIKNTEDLIAAFDRPAEPTDDQTNSPGPIAPDPIAPIMPTGRTGTGRGRKRSSGSTDDEPKQR